ncbi:hypothetical protein CAPTEDRAFT_224096 [Capitella teleta]|uniref:SH3 domain-containing protein n=1 Tax=Capitella teleta TaxID=283909 RepID=R7U5B0_CAPTE|nr:hypothetical protein CAPTEDRAFT_224096 [Capitella teleta]|eukprot:ELU01555.1 hypothetical protein CAPTEDRAFT_224096 [Capitella teleta]
MSIAGFKKQINKANQYVSEKIGGAKGTELDDEFVEMEKKVDVMGKLVDELMARTHELLQPNPASRAKLSAVRSISKMRGQANHTLYPQPEGLLGECMIKHGRDLGEDSLFGQALVESGESYKQLAEIKYSLEDAVKQNFIEPLQHLQSKDLKEVNHHRKKLSGRRLDFDCKKRKQTRGAHVSDHDINMAEDKFVESKDLTETAMFNLIENDAEQVSELCSFIEAELRYHQQSADTLQALMESLQQKCNEAANRPRREHVPRRVSSRTKFDTSPSGSMYDNGSTTNTNNFDLADSTGYSLSPAPQTFNAGSSGGGSSQACAEALYDFDPENEGELGFKEGDIINLISQIDENWYEGSFQGVNGFFPVNYVKVIVALP